MNTNKNTKKGFYIVEAAIFLPIFIVAVLTLGYLIKITEIQENVFNSIYDEAGKIACEANVAPTALLIVNNVEERLVVENPRISNVKVDNLLFRFPLGKYNDLIYFRTTYDIHIGLPLGIFDGFEIENRIVFRAFTGKKSLPEKMLEEELEEEEKSEIVYIFPKSGKRYHDANCTYIKVYPIRQSLNNSVKMRFSPCKLCDSRDLPAGSIVYCFTGSGKVYHTGDCSTVDKYVIEIEKADAVEKGYSACLKCGGV